MHSFVRRGAARLLIAALFFGGAPAFSASEKPSKQFLETLQRRFPNTQGAIVTRAMPGYWAIVKDDQVVFIDDALTVLVTGDVVDLKTNQSLSAKLLEAQRPKVSVASIPLNNAIQFGAGSRRLVVFSDPDCPHCKRIEHELAQLKDVSIYVLPYPITQLHPEASERARAIWCSDKPAQAWREYLLEGRMPAQFKADCRAPLAENLALGAKWRITGTPTLVFDDGTVMPGAATAARIEAQLQAAHR
jgi:thiol:disulfide interchange protein DsbC